MADEDAPKRLAAKMRRAREFTLEIGGFKFTLKRPTETEFVDKIRHSDTTECYLPFVVGWEGVKEMDMLNGGDPHPLPFDAEVCREWLRDRGDLYSPIIDAINKSFTDYAMRQVEAAKN